MLDLRTGDVRLPARARSSPTLVLADEINRAPAKTQSALLEAMQERQVTVDGDHPPAAEPVPRDRHPEPDRVGGHVPAAGGAARPVHPADLASAMPDAATRSRSSRRRLERGTDEVDLDAVLDAGQFRAVQRSIERVEVEPCITATSSIWSGPPERRRARRGREPARLARRLKLARARAVIAGRDFVTPDDVKEVALAGLAHRVVLTPEAWARRVDPVVVVETAVQHRAGTVVAVIQPRRDRRALGYLTLAFGFTLLALVRGEPLDLVLAAPFAAVLILGLRSIHPIDVTVLVRYETARRARGRRGLRHDRDRPSARRDHHDLDRRARRLDGAWTRRRR